MCHSLVPSPPPRKERLVTIPGPNTSQCLRYVVTGEWRLYGFADYHEICEYIATAAFALSSQSYEPEIVYNLHATYNADLKETERPTSQGAGEERGWER